MRYIILTLDAHQKILAYPMQTIFHLLMFGPAGVILIRVGLVRTRIGLIVTCVGSVRLFGYQHVGISNAQWSRWGSKPMRWPNASGFSLQWNIGFRLNKKLPKFN